MKKAAPHAPSDNLPRCEWVRGGNALYFEYHDREWGAPVREDARHFEFLILEGAQAGLSWATILNKRENYRRAFAEFNPEKVARFTPAKIAALLENPGIVRNRLKVEAAVSNARAFLKVAEEFGSFDAYAWRFMGGSPRQNRFGKKSDVPDATPESEALSRELKRRGFRFVGPTIVYAHMQATGMVNDHETGCFRHKPCAEMGKNFQAAAPRSAAT